jgi:hypothetical protein
MTTLSLDRSPAAVRTPAATVAYRIRRKRWFARFLAALYESRMRAARIEIARHRHLLPAGYDLGGGRRVARREAAPD